MKSELIAIRLDKELAQTLKSDVVPISKQVRAAIRLFLQYPREKRYNLIREYETDIQPTSVDIEESPIAVTS
jgi:hypothetical protein